MLSLKPVSLRSLFRAIKLKKDRFQTSVTMQANWQHRKGYRSIKKQELVIRLHWVIHFNGRGLCACYFQKDQHGFKCTEYLGDGDAKVIQ